MSDKDTTAVGLAEPEVASKGWKAHRALKTLSRCNRALVRAKAEHKLLEEVCRAIVEEGGYRLAWVGYAEDDEAKTIRPVAHAGFEQGYLDTLDLTWADAERGRCPSCTAVRTKRLTVAQHILAEPGSAPWREEALKRGYASAIALPLVRGQEVFGALNVYADEPDAFGPEEVALLKELSDDLAFGISSLRTTEEHGRALGELRKLSDAVEQSPSVAVITDTEGRIEYVNPRFTETTGYSLEEALGKNTFILKSGEQPPEFYEELWKTITSGGRWHGVFHNRKKNGELYWERASISPVTDREGVITHFVKVAEDVTEQKEAEEKLHEAHESLKRAYENLGRAQAVAASSEKLAALGRLTAGVSHEILNPLNGIVINLHLLLEDANTPKEMSEDLREMLEQANRITRISQNLLFFARQRPTERKPIDLMETVTRTVNLLEHKIRMNNVAIGYRTGENLLAVSADRNQMQQVVLNLINNAVDAMPDGGTVVIEIEEAKPVFIEEGRAVELRVRDTGIGIEPKNMDKLFDPFFTTKPEGEGTGLGLSICQGIVENHGGSIWAEDNPGGGAVFVVRLSAEDGR